jgi:hypothetical protein
MTTRTFALLQCIRLSSLITAVVIVIGSLGFYSSNSIPLSITDEQDQGNTWIIQTITDRRLISTLVAAQASIFCPLFILLSTSSENTTCFIEMACQFMMPLGLAFSWMFSILFDLKSTDIIGQQDMCLLQENCIVFYFIYYMKYFLIGLFSIETSLITFSLISNQKRHIQLPIDEEKQ